MWTSSKYFLNQKFSENKINPNQNPFFNNIKQNDQVGSLVEFKGNMYYSASINGFNILYKSMDGINFTKFEAQGIKGIIEKLINFNGCMYALVDIGGVSKAKGYSLYKSMDGINFTEIKIKGIIGVISNLLVFDKIFYLTTITSGITGSLYKSTNGINFTKIETSEIKNNVGKIFNWNNNLYLSNDDMMNPILYKSIDGTNFTKIDNLGIQFGVIFDSLNFKNNLYITTNLGQLFVHKN